MSKYCNENVDSVDCDTSVTYLCIYAPGISVTVSGGGPVFGALVGKTLVNSGNSSLHYDVALPSVYTGRSRFPSER